MSRAADGTLKCDMGNCNAVVTHLDEGGFIYCAWHGKERRAWKRCRKLRPHELAKLARGEAISRY